MQRNENELISDESLKVLIINFSIQLAVFEQGIFINEVDKRREEEELIKERIALLILVFIKVRVVLPTDCEKYQHLTALIERLKQNHYHSLSALDEEIKKAQVVVSDPRDKSWWGSMKSLLFYPNTHYKLAEFIEPSGEFKITL